MKRQFLIILCIAFISNTYAQNEVWVGTNYFKQQKNIWTSPAKIDSNNWHKWLISGAIIGSSFALDRTINKHLPQQKNLENITHIGDPLSQIAIPFVTWGLGNLTQNERTIHTGYNLGFAVINTATVTLIFKGISGRERPSDSEDPFIFQPFSDWNSSFFSGHTAGCFAMSAILMNEYKDKRWIGYASLGVSTLVGASRITTHEHWFSDVVTGAIIGYAIGDLTYKLNESKSFKIIPSIGKQQQSLSLVYQL